MRRPQHPQHRSSWMAKLLFVDQKEVDAFWTDVKGLVSSVLSVVPLTKRKPRGGNSPPLHVWIGGACIITLIIMSLMKVSGVVAKEASSPSKPRFSMKEVSNSVNYTVEERAEQDAQVQAPTTSSGKMKCAKGTDDLGVHTGYVRHVAYSLRLCALPIYSTSEESTPGSAYYVSGANKRAIVSAAKSYSFINLIRAARKQGITLGATSSFRTMAHQTSLWNGSDKTGVWVASPGGSPHQSGSAIDFYFRGVLNTGRNCRWQSGKCTLSGYRTWDWLNANVGKYGIVQYVNEFWHFNG